MKKIKTQLQFTKTTVRVLQGAQLTAIQGGFIGRGLSENPAGCAAASNHPPDGVGTR